MVKAICSFLMICMFYVCSIVLFVPRVSHATGWPITPRKAVCADEERGLIFYASGDTVLILNKDDLTQKSIIRIASNHGEYGFEGIQSAFYYEKGEEKRLYLALGTQGLRVYDVKHPDNPVQLFDDYYNEPAIETKYSGTNVRASDVAVDDDHIYIIDHMYGVRLLDHELSIDKANLGLKAPSITRIELFPDYAYVLRQSKGFGIIQKNSESPFLEGSGFFDVPGQYVGLSGAYDLQVKENHAYVSNTSKGIIHFIDISNKIEPKETDTYLSEEYGTSLCGLYISGDRLYITDSLKGMEVIDISDPSHPGNIIGSIDARGAHIVYVDNEYVSFLADTTNGLKRIDPAIKKTHEVPRPAGCNSVFTKYGYAYAVDSNGHEEGLRIFRISYDTGINLLGFIATPGDANKVFVSGNYAYIADGSNGVVIVDISSRTEPVITSRIETDGKAEDVFISGDYAYIADGGNGVVIVDISEPTAPDSPTVLKTAEDATGIFVSGSYAYIVTGTHITIADISEPAFPVVTNSTIKTAGTPHKVYIYNDYAYIADGTNGMAVVKLFSDGSLAPSIVTTYPADGGGIVDICGAGNYLYLARGDKGCSIVDISDPASPSKIQDIPNSSSVSGVHISEGKVVLAEGNEGLSFFAQYEKADPDQINGMEQSSVPGACFIDSACYRR